MGQIALSALILCASLYFIARHEAEISLPVILMITAGVSVTGALAALAVGPFALLLVFVLLAWAIQRFCYVRWSIAWIVTGIYAVSNIALSVGIHMLRKA